jgi:hypothetical protein
MLLRLLALTLAAAAALLTYEFFLSVIVAGHALNVHWVLLHRVLPGTAGIVLAMVARVWWLRRKRLSDARLESGKEPENSI